MRKNSLIKASKFLFLLSLIATVFVGCKDDDDDSSTELGNWIKRSSFNGDSRSSAAAFTIGNKGYLVTGDDGDDLLDDTWVYDLDGDSWQELAEFPGGRRRGAVGFAVNGIGYVGTGFDGDDRLHDFYAYDPATNTWSQIADFPNDETDETDGRFGAVGFSLNGFGYVGTGNDGSTQKDFYKYDPTTNTWVEEIGFGGDKREGAFVFLIDGVAYIGGGTSNGLAEEDFYSFDGITWTKLGDLADNDDDDDLLVTYVNGAAFSIGGKGYVGTGLNAAITNTAWEYTPQDDSWEQITNFQGSSRFEASGFTFENANRGFILMGRNGTSSSSYFDDVFEFQPDVLNTEDNN